MKKHIDYMNSKDRKESQKAIKYLRGLVGLSVIRTKPIDWRMGDGEFKSCFNDYDLPININWCESERRDDGIFPINIDKCESTRRDDGIFPKIEDIFESHFNDESDFVDYSYTDDPIIITGLTSDGRIICKDVDGRYERILDTAFTDCNWVKYSSTFKATKNPLNKLRGQKVRRIRPTTRGDKSFMSGNVVIVNATYSHVVIEFKGEKVVLGREYTNHKDWEEVKEM